MLEQGNLETVHDIELIEDYLVSAYNVLFHMAKVELLP